MAKNKKLTKKVRREMIAAKGGKDPAQARAQQAAREARAKLGHIVVVQRGQFELADVGSPHREADRSLGLRTRLFGLGPDGQPARGLERGEALSLRRKLQAARDRRRGVARRA